jgi:hypothetical protein
MERAALPARYRSALELLSSGFTPAQAAERALNPAAQFTRPARRSRCPACRHPTACQRRQDRAGDGHRLEGRTCSLSVVDGRAGRDARPSPWAAATTRCRSALKVTGVQRDPVFHPTPICSGTRPSHARRRFRRPEQSRRRRLGGSVARTMACTARQPSRSAHQNARLHPAHQLGCIAGGGTGRARHEVLLRP